MSKQTGKILVEFIGWMNREYAMIIGLFILGFIAGTTWTFPMAFTVEVKPNDIVKALKNGDNATLKTLLDKNPDLAKSTLDVGDFSFPMLNFVINRESAEILVEKGANVNFSEPKSKLSPLYTAAEEGRMDVVEFLVLKGAEVNAKAITNDTPLHAAAGSGHLEIAKFLFSKGGSLSIRGNADMTPLDNACYGGHLDVAKFLVSAGADVNFGDWTCVHWASREGRDSVLSYLISVGADIHKKNSDGKSPIHMASEEGCFEAVKILVAAGANLDAKDNSGKTPADVAKTKEISDFLRKLKAA